MSLIFSPSLLSWHGIEEAIKEATEQTPPPPQRTRILTKGYTVGSSEKIQTADYAHVARLILN